MINQTLNSHLKGNNLRLNLLINLFNECLNSNVWQKWKDY